MHKKEPTNVSHRVVPRLNCSTALQYDQCLPRSTFNCTHAELLGKSKSAMQRRHANYPNLLSFCTYTSDSSQPFTVMLWPFVLVKEAIRITTRRGTLLAHEETCFLKATRSLCFACSVTSRFKPSFPSP